MCRQAEFRARRESAGSAVDLDVRLLGRAARNAAGARPARHERRLVFTLRSRHARQETASLESAIANSNELCYAHANVGTQLPKRRRNFGSRNSLNSERNRNLLLKRKPYPGVRK